MNNSIVIEKPSRWYRVGQFFGNDSFWYAEFRPVNPKSGKPWQASRGLSCGDVSHSLWKGDCGGCGYVPGSEVVRPGLPSKDWMSEGFSGCRVGYASKEAALAAVEIYEASRA